MSCANATLDAESMDISEQSAATKRDASMMPNPDPNPGFQFARIMPQVVAGSQSAHAHRELMHAPRIGLRHLEMEAAELGFFAGFGQMAHFAGDHAADGVELVVAELAAEALVEIGDRRQRADQEAAVGLRLDQFGFGLVDIVLVVDVADDLLEHVLDRDEAGDAAVFVDDDRHVVAREAEFLEQDVEALGFGNHRDRPQQRADVARTRPWRDSAAVLGEQDAEDLVLVAVVHRKARVPRFDDDVEDVFLRRVDRQEHGLRARHHDVGDRELGDLDRALDHRQRVVRKQAVRLRVAQLFDQFLAALRLTGQRLRQAREPGSVRGCTGRVLAH